MIVQIGLAGIILLSYNLTSIILGLSSLFLIAIYPFAKRFTWWPQVFLGLAFNWGILLLFVAHTGSLSWPIIALYFSGIFWTLFYDTIYAYQDSQDDLLIGVKSTTKKMLHGVRRPNYLSVWRFFQIKMFNFSTLHGERDAQNPYLTRALFR